jgi:23S rRNA pseudouridine1911/1915/1917 synthase
MRLEVTAEENKLSLKRFLTARFPTHSVMYLAGRVVKGACAIDGAPADWGKKLRAGQFVEIDIDLDAATARTPEPIPLEIIHEDEELLAVDKPHGMLVHPTKHVKTGTLANALAHYLHGQRFWFPHRLDRDVSGVIVVAKTAESMNRLARLWLSKQVAKRYVAVLAGIVEGDAFDIDAPIGRDPNRKPEWAIDAAGKSSLTKLEVLSRMQARTLAALYPITGRTNQLRLHAGHIGHPILGDELYGGPAAPRLYLHAEELVIEGRCFAAPLSPPRREREGWPLE